MIKNRRFNRMIALVVMVATVLVILFSTVFLVKHAHHHCCGEDCPVCAVMLQCSNNLRSIGTAIFFVAIGVYLFTSLLKKVYLGEDINLGNSLISQKVRMNN